MENIYPYTSLNFNLSKQDFKKSLQNQKVYYIPTSGSVSTNTNRNSEKYVIRDPDIQYTAMSDSTKFDNRAPNGISFKREPPTGTFS